MDRAQPAAEERNRRKAVRFAAGIVVAEHIPGTRIDVTITRILAEEDWTRFGWKPSLVDVLAELTRICLVQEGGVTAPRDSSRLSRSERVLGHFRALVDEEGMTPQELVQVAMLICRGTGTA